MTIDDNGLIGYPSLDGTHFANVINSYRCTSTIDVGRCALFDNHKDAHAYGEIITAKPWKTVVHRWDDDGRRWIDKPGLVLPWAALHHD